MKTCLSQLQECAIKRWQCPLAFAARQLIWVCVCACEWVNVNYPWANTAIKQDVNIRGTRAHTHTAIHTQLCIHTRTISHSLPAGPLLSSEWLTFGKQTHMAVVFSQLFGGQRVNKDLISIHSGAQETITNKTAVSHRSSALLAFVRSTEGSPQKKYNFKCWLFLVRFHFGFIRISDSRVFILTALELQHKTVVIILFANLIIADGCPNDSILLMFVWLYLLKPSTHSLTLSLLASFSRTLTSLTSAVAGTTVWRSVRSSTHTSQRISPTRSSPARTRSGVCSPHAHLYTHTHSRSHTHTHTHSQSHTHTQALRPVNKIRSESICVCFHFAQTRTVLLNVCITSASSTEEKFHPGLPGCGERRDQVHTG